MLIYPQSVLASSVLYVGTLALCKLSLLYFLDRLVSVSQATFKSVLRGIGAVLLVYLVSLSNPEVRM